MHTSSKDIFTFDRAPMARDHLQHLIWFEKLLQSSFQWQSDQSAQYRSKEEEWAFNGCCTRLDHGSACHCVNTVIIKELNTQYHPYQNIHSDSITLLANIKCSHHFFFISWGNGKWILNGQTPPNTTKIWVLAVSVILVLEYVTPNRSAIIKTLITPIKINIFRCSYFVLFLNYF